MTTRLRAATALLAILMASPALPAADAPADAPVVTGEKRPIPRGKPGPTERQTLAVERQRTCGAEWRKLKASRATQGQSWQQFRKACLDRAKAAQAAF